MGENSYEDFRKERIFTYADVFFRYNQQMSLLVKSGKKPFTIEQALRFRLSQDSLAWSDKPIATGSAIVSLPRSDLFKIALDTDFFLGLDDQTRLVNGAMVISKEAYDKIDSPEFSRKKLSNRFNTPLTRREIGMHPVWSYVVKDRKLLREARKYLFGTSLERAMGVNPGQSEEYTSSRPWILTSASSGFQLGSANDVNLDCGYLIGYKD